jgi:hypothetical protein
MFVTKGLDTSSSNLEHLLLWKSSPMNIYTCIWNLTEKKNCFSDYPDCPAPRTSSSSSIKFCSSSKSICEFECTGTEQLSRPAPKYKLCSMLGVYNPLQPREDFVLPACGGRVCYTIYNCLKALPWFSLFLIHQLSVAGQIVVYYGSIKPKCV